MTKRAGATLRAALLSGCALVVLGSQIHPALAMGGTPVPVGCVVADGADNVLSCSGDLSAGVPFAALAALPGLPPIIMNVFDITKDITPTDVPGIALVFAGGDVILNSDLGSHRIVTRNSLPGILAQGRNVSIKHKGDIVASGYGSYGIMAMAEYCDCEEEEEDPFSAPGVPASKPALSEVVTLVSNANITVDSLGAGILAAGGAGVSVVSTGNIRAGYRSNGILAISGGAGSEFGAFSIGGTTVVSTGNITLDNRGPRGGEGIPDLGEFSPPFQAGIFAANGGMSSVKVISKGDITTEGSLRHGIFATAEGFSPDETVDVNSTGDITTAGTGSSGIFARSTFADVMVESRGNISTRGRFADGIHGESDFGGKVSIISDGDIDASGDGAYGIYAAGYSDISVTVNGGTVSGGSGDGGGIAFFAGGNNKLINRGTITGGKSGWAVEGDTLGSETVENYGTISGNVELNLEPSDDWSGAQFVTKAAQDIVTTDAFNNRAGATFNSGEFVQLGNAGLLLNQGTLNPGGAGEAATTNLDGRLEQTRSGVLGIDIDKTKADRIDIFTSAPLAAAIATATLSGKVVPNLMSFDTSSARQQFTIISATGEVVDDGLTVTDTALVDYELLYPNANEVVLSLQADFSGTGLSPNQAALVTYLGRLLGSDGAGKFDDLFIAFLSAPDPESVAQLANQMLTGAGNSALSAMFVGEAFGNAMRSCAVAGGEYSQLRETSCLWAKPFAREFSQSGGTDRADIDSNSAGFAGGIQTQLSEKVFVGGGFSIEQTNAALDFTSRQEGTWWQFGGVLKYVDGPLKLSASVNGGQGDLDLTRQAGLVPVTAESGTDVTFVTNLARLAYSFGEMGFYVTPMLDGGATYVEMGGFTETGAGLFNLAVSSSDQWIFFGGPAVEIGATIAQGGFELRPYIKAGVTFLSEDSFDIEARFAVASTAVAPFRVTSNFDDTFATLDAGVQLFSTDGLNLRLNYQGKFGEDSHENGVDAKLSINY